jgi:predicted GNAT family N-acyltransferase
MKIDFRGFSCPGEDYDLALDLRYRELRQPLGLVFTEEELGKDIHDLHYGLFAEGKILSCLTVSDMGAKVAKIRQVATDRRFQGKGLGIRLGKEVENILRRDGFERLFCHARATAVPFYEKQLYVICSEEFKEVGIPHYLMEKYLL